MPSTRLPRSGHTEDNAFSPRKGFVPFAAEEVEGSIVDRFRSVVARRQDGVAILEGSRQVTYGALLQQATRCAAALDQRAGAGPEGLPVVLLLPRSIDAVVVALGALLTGRPYLWLSPRGPESLRDAVISTVSPAVVVAAEVPPGLATARWTTPEQLLADTTSPAVTPLVAPDTPACLFATSGSSGTPKLVVLSHRAIVFDTGRQINDLFLGPDDRFDWMIDGSFSGSLACVFSALLSGATLLVGPEAEDPAKLAQWLAEVQPTISTMTVSHLRLLVGEWRRGRVPVTLRLLSLGGEPLLAQDVRAAQEVLPATCVIQNAMASTETRTYAQFFIRTGQGVEDPVPAGWAVHGKTVCITDSSGELVSGGQVGDIHVRSRYIATGYAHDERLSSLRFRRLADGEVMYSTGDRGYQRPDGAIVFVGRTDNQVKVLGQRIELEAVEHVLMMHPAVGAAAVAQREVSAGQITLVAFVVPANSTEVSGATAVVGIDGLLGYVGRHVPQAAVPSRLVVVEALPRLVSGKVDRQALQAMSARGEHSEAGQAAPAILDALTGIWAEVLSQPCSPDTDLFEAGGDSLRVVSVQVGIERTLRMDVSFDVIVASRSPRRLARRLAANRSSRVESVLVTLRNPGAGRPLFCVPGIGGEPASYLQLAQHLDDRAVYGFRAWGETVLPSGALTIEWIAGCYVEAIDAVLPPEEPVHLCGHSFGGVVALEMVHQLSRRGRPVSVFAIIDTPLSQRYPSMARRVIDVGKNLPNWVRYDLLMSDWPTIVARFAGKASKGWERLRSAFTGQPMSEYPDYRSYFGKRHVPEPVQERFRLRLDAIRRYTKRPVTQPCVLFRSRAQALLGRSDRTLGWEELTTGVLVHDVPGHHDSCTSPPHVAHLARALVSALRQAEVS